MKTLELFAGTQSFSKCVLLIGEEALTVDILNKFTPTFCCDILTFDYKQFAVGEFDIIWCSPPCTEYSKAKTRGVRDFDTADALVRKSFEILDYLKPSVWILENVGTGKLVDRMETIRPGLQKVFVDYCCYGKPYRKRTVLWSNKPFTLELCRGSGHCSSMAGQKHIGSVGNGSDTYNSVGVGGVWEKDEIPELLLFSILDQILWPTDSPDPLQQ